MISRITVLWLAATLVAACSLLPMAPAVPEGPPIECLGLPQAVCDDTINQVGREAIEAGLTLVRIRIRCTSPTGCTNEAGSLEYEAWRSNGSTVGGGHGWASAGPAPIVRPGAPAPAPAVEPTCLGVPLQWCRDLVTGIDVGGDSSAVVSIVVRCTTTCTLEEGEGETVVTLRDGTELKPGWSYSGAPP